MVFCLILLGLLFIYLFILKAALYRAFLSHRRDCMENEKIIGNKDIITAYHVNFLF